MRTNNRPLFWILLSAACGFGTSWPSALAAQPTSWTFEDVAPFGVQSDIALDATGEPHIVFVNCYWHGACQAADTSAARLRYAYRTGGSWMVEDVVQPAHGTPSMAIGPSGDIHTAFQHTAWREIWYARRNSGGWAAEPLAHDNPTYVKKHPSLVLDTAENPHVAFYERESIEYTVRIAGEWNEEGVPNSWIEEWASMTPLVLDSQGMPHIGAKTYVPSDPIHFHKMGGNWNEETLYDLFSGHNTAMTVDASDGLHMAYYGDGLNYATNSSGGWEWDVVDADADFGWPGSIALDISATPFIAHLDVNEALVLYYKASSGWIEIPVDDDGLHPAIAIAPDGTVHLTYYDQTTEMLRHGTHPPPQPPVGIPDRHLSPDLDVVSWPNPFNPSTTIAYSIANAGLVELHVYDARGRLVRSLVNEPKGSGDHRVTWNGEDDNNALRPSGVYFVRLRFGGQVQTRRLVLLK
jgi:hypothetical protein